NSLLKRYTLKKLLLKKAYDQNLNAEQWCSIQKLHDVLGAKYKTSTLLDYLEDCEKKCKVDLSELKSFLLG
ncbi:MAG: hypothetical protein J5I47_09330, partial [Vicingus serpentipes]|nr:hypothetical protein [Vicingus serpentipes]